MFYRILVLSLCVVSLIYGCSSDNNSNPNSNVIAPKINSLSSTTLKIGDIVTINGSGFGASQSTSYVSFNAINATQYNSWSDIEVKVVVPSGTTSGKVSITVNGIKSNELDFTILSNCSEKSTYTNVTIGTQVWMGENLDVCTYRNGDQIPEVKDTTAWINLKTGAWCYYNNDPAMGAIFGKLYNWHALNDPRGLAPAGWHVPSETEWTKLETFLGGSLEAGGKLKSTGTKEGGDGLWNSPNKEATNSSGFSAFPGGWRSNYNFTFYGFGFNSGLWSATEYNATDAWSRYLYFNMAIITKGNRNKECGFSVRCVKD